jgi:hypothetical protein
MISEKMKSTKPLVWSSLLYFHIKPNGVNLIFLYGK